MKRRTFILTAATLGLGALAATTTLAHGPGYGSGTGPMMDGSGYMQGQGGQGMGPQGQGMGQGYHGYGHGHGYQGKGFGPGNENCLQNQALDKPLTVDDVRANLEQRLAWRGNDRLKVGKVEDKDENTITAEIVTVDDSLVRRIEIDKATGRHVPVQ